MIEVNVEIEILFTDPAIFKYVRMQAKDVSAIRVVTAIQSLRYAPWNPGFPPASTPRWVFNDELEAAMPDVPPKVLLAKLRSLLKRRIVDGCPCGRCSDWEPGPRFAEFLL